MGSGDIQKVNAEVLQRDEDGVRVGMVLVKKIQSMLSDAVAVSKKSSLVDIKRAEMGLELLEKFGDVDKFIDEFQTVMDICAKRGDTRALARLMETKWKYLFEVQQNMDKILGNITQQFVQMNNLFPSAPKSGEEGGIDAFMKLLEKHAGSGNPNPNPIPKPGSDERPGAKFKRPEG